MMQWLPRNSLKVLAVPHVMKILCGNSFVFFRLPVVFQVKSVLTGTHLGTHHNCISDHGTARTFNTVLPHLDLQWFLRTTIFFIEFPMSNHNRLVSVLFSVPSTRFGPYNKKPN